jgi:GAF domain-containing protein
MIVPSPISFAAIQALFECAPLGIAIYDADQRYVDVNEAFANLDCLTREAHRGRHLEEVLPDLAIVIAPVLKSVFATGTPIIDYAMIGTPVPDAEARHWLASYLPAVENGRIVAVVSLVREVTSEIRTQLLLQAQKQILEQFASGDSLADVLTMIARTLQHGSVDGFIPSILLLDEDGETLRLGAAPGLPAVYNGAIDGSRIGPKAGSCGTALYRREMVIVEDILTDPLWEAYRHLAMPHGLRACWSTPIVGSSGRLLGSFALYYRSARRPSPDDVQLIQLMARTTALVIELRRGEEDRQRRPGD